METIEIIKNNGEREVFDPEKLGRSLKRSGATVFVVNEIVDTITKSLKDGMRTSEIYKKAFSLLKKTEYKGAVRYSLRRSILSLGPSGFPFEEYVAKLFEAKGFTTSTGQVVQGNCVEHEIDIIAYNDKEVLMTEAKFHNENGTKSDTKVALYIKARFDDLTGVEFNIGGKKRKMTRGLLITNTKFTETAKKYGTCVNTFDMIGWDYPKKGNLYDLIEETGLHPMTCIPQLSQHDKQELLRRGISTCPALKENAQVLMEIGVNPNKIKDIIDNIDEICSHNHD